VKQIIKLEVGEGRGSIWIEATEIAAENPSGRKSVGLDMPKIGVTLASSFEQFKHVFEIAQKQLSVLAHHAQETSVEISAKLSTQGHLIIVQGSAESSIKVTMKWTTPKDEHQPSTPS